MTHASDGMSASLLLSWSSYQLAKKYNRIAREMSSSLDKINTISLSGNFGETQIKAAHWLTLHNWEKSLSPWKWFFLSGRSHQEKGDYQRFFCWFIWLSIRVQRFGSVKPRWVTDEKKNLKPTEFLHGICLTIPSVGWNITSDRVTILQQTLSGTFGATR